VTMNTWYPVSPMHNARLRGHSGTLAQAERLTLQAT
jgi:hypothetical protein